MMNKSPTILWFRQDLRLHDNSALNHAIDLNKPILPIYIIDPANPKPIGSASKWWLHQSLSSLNKTLQGKMAYFIGNPAEIIMQLAQEVKADTVLWNRCYEPYSMQRDANLKKTLQEKQITTKSFAGYLLKEPHNSKKKDGTEFKVFTPFYKQIYLEQPYSVSQPEPLKSLQFDLFDYHKRLKLEELNLIPEIKWYKEFSEYWQPGEAGAEAKFDEFIANGISNYAEGRNRPDLPHTSRFSPYLHFGEISVRYIWHKILRKWEETGNVNFERYMSELVWREFSYYIMYYFPELPYKNWQSKFDAFPWQNNQELLQKWQKGLTGYPIVDAGMRELWRTGYMHNRVRMIVGSFLVKHLLIDWRQGEEWFWDCLLDADLANNAASWQWVSGSGADSAPYFRIFNPITQGEKFDPNGKYVKKFVPELAKLPIQYLFSPWEAPKEILQHAGIVLGVDYPKPIIDHSKARELALAALAQIKKQ